MAVEDSICDCCERGDDDAAEVMSVEGILDIEREVDDDRDICGKLSRKSMLRRSRGLLEVVRSQK